MLEIFKELWPSCENGDHPSKTLFCKKCFEVLKFSNACIECGERGDSEICQSCQSKTKPWRKLSATFKYEGGVRSWLHDMKANGRYERLRELNREDLVTPSGVDALIAVTSDPRASRRRGFDVGALLAERLSKLWSLPLISDVFERAEFLTSQKNLSQAGRRDFLRQVVGLKPIAAEKLKDLRVLLIDDIMTSGATLEVHASLLRPHVFDLQAYNLARTLKEVQKR